MSIDLDTAAMEAGIISTKEQSVGCRFLSDLIFKTERNK